jgi:hypothetical protein
LVEKAAQRLEGARVREVFGGVAVQSPDLEEMERFQLVALLKRLHEEAGLRAELIEEETDEGE